MNGLLFCLFMLLLLIISEQFVFVNIDILIVGIYYNFFFVIVMDEDIYEGFSIEFWENIVEFFNIYFEY